ncbi:putative multidrug resistance ABC transporter ATP-binding/permease protein YheI [Pirellula sp. SH-Sr6A]|uniref:ATP-binding cassette domain-containing protein n=1 Tax=Pirellula sp. SH-Sr6A TaxID=1632865 RepID=UPI00078DED6C|nr:ABC transporter ATP-binding protein [Pirellula sp. SH-Sr6A]AMV33009.1 putative multidrug resistance ABC transporter ATP-binding/permease protein YheI [Pirellula sp. SH-Sr6A]
MLRQQPDPGQSIDQVRELMRLTLCELAAKLDIPIESNEIQRSLADSAVDIADDSWDAITLLMMRSAQGIGIRLSPVELQAPDVWELLLEGFAIVQLQREVDGETAYVYSNIHIGKIDETRLTIRNKQSDSMSKRELVRRVRASSEKSIFFIAERALVCEPTTTQANASTDRVRRVAADHAHHAPHQHDHRPRISPQQRFLRFLKFDSRDIWTLVIFGFVVGVLELATPLAVEQMVTTIGFASLTQPLIWLAVLLFGILSLSAVIKGIQYFVVEILQRRMFVRIVGDLSERLPRLERSSMDGLHGPELANRFFDVMTMQKSTAMLLIDGLSLVIRTVTGLLLLAIYSPYLLAFDVVLIICMTIFLLLLGRGAVRTAIEESLVKYRIAHWLQDVIGNPVAFQVHGAGELVTDRSNRLTVEYLGARRDHFVVLIRQTLFSLMLYAISITAILSLGVWLVLSESLNIGQLVASVSVVAVVVGAFASIGKSLEAFYDLMAATDKVGHLLDLPTLPPSRSLDAGIGPVEVRLRGLTVSGSGNLHFNIGDMKIASGERFALCGEGECGKSLLLQTLSGLRPPTEGMAEIGGIDSREVNRFAEGSMVSVAGTPEIFHGTISENISLRRLSVPSSEVRHSLINTEMWDEVLAMTKGLETMLQTGGYPLSHTQMARLTIARAIATKPRLLLIDGTLDVLPPKMRYAIWDHLRDSKQPWTLVVVTHDPVIIEQCDGHKDLSSCLVAHK